MAPQIVASPHEDVTIHGHILSVIIHREPGAAPEEGVRQFQETGALIDTGASDICVDYRIAQALKLRQVDQRTIGTAGGSVEVAVYNGMFEVPLLGFKRMMRLFAPRELQRPHRAITAQRVHCEFQRPNGRGSLHSPKGASSAAAARGRRFSVVATLAGSPRNAADFRLAELFWFGEKALKHRLGKLHQV